jgi:hypothetical protein
MHLPLLLSALLCLLLSSALAFNLTYPIKGAFIGWQAVNWSAPGAILNVAADGGYNLAILTFYSDVSNDMLSAWDGISAADKTSYLDYAHSKGMAVLFSAWIQKEYGDLIDIANATSLGTELGSQVVSRNFDGIDIQIRDQGAGFTIGSLNSNESVTWVVDLTTAIRQTIGQDAIITFSPYATDFGPIGGSAAGGPGTLGGYTSIHPRISSMIQHYNVFFLGAGTYCYVDYESLFVQSSSTCTAGTAMKQISENANIPLDRLVVTKPISAVLQLSGYVTPPELQSMLSTGHAYLDWNAGAVGWTWNYTDNISAYWISDIYPLLSLNITPSPPPTSSSESPITGECGTNQVLENGKCVCTKGFYASGGTCSRTSLLVVAIIIPILVVVAIVVVIVWWVVLRGKRTHAPARLASKTLSIPELENNYLTTNLITDYNAIIIKSRLGRGGSGVVNMGVWRHIEVAVKEFTNQDIQTTDFIRESEIHAKLRHPNVVQLLAICLPPHMCTISEYMAKGSLSDVIQQKPTAFTWKRKLQCLHDIAKGMDYLHKSKIIHRDLKSQNCLVDKNWNCKIADFGTSKLVSDVNQTATAYVPRTAQWTAPEVILRGEYSEKSDVYSYAVIMWECLTGEIPYDGMFAFAVEDSTVKGSRLAIPEGCDEWFANLMTQCWSADPNERPNFETINPLVEKQVR